MTEAATWTFFPGRDFDKFASDWDSIVAAGSNSPVLTSAVFSAALRHLGSGKEQLGIARVAGRIVAMTLLQRNGALRIETFQPAQLPIGAWVQLPGTRLGALATELVLAMPIPVLVAGISQQDPLFIPRPESEAGSAIETGDYIETSAVDVSGPFDSYWNARGQNLRQNVRKQHNKLAREGLAARMDFITEEARTTEAVDRYGILESAGWKGRDGTALNPGNAQGSFYRELLSTCAGSRGALVAECYIGEVLVCSNLCIVRDGVVVILKTAHSESEGRFSPATLLNYELFQFLCASTDYRRVEFYGRVMDWHRRWMTDSRTMYHISVYRRSLIRKVVSVVRKMNAHRRQERVINQTGTAV